jgi:anti-sigma B factor antagonist
MRIESRVKEGVVILDLSGKIRIGDETQVLRTQVNSLTQAGVQRILLNLKSISDIDSSGIGELASAHATVSRKGGQLKLEHLNHRLLKLLAMTKLLTVFDVFDDEEEAVASYYA